MAQMGIEYLRTKLAKKRTKVLTRYEYYECKEPKNFPSPVVPQQLKSTYKSTLGWCAKAVDSLADRLVFDKMENDDYNMNEIFDMNNPDVFFDSSVLSALISACCFVYISPDDTGYPRLQVIDGSNATGILDPITNLLTEGYAVLERNEFGSVVAEAYFVPGRTDYLYRDERKSHSFFHKVDYPLLVPIIYRPDAARPFGHSRISRTCMSLQDKAKNTITRADISAEFYSYPQKYILGTSVDDEPLDSWRATISSMLEITKDEDGDKPTVGQFTQQSMEPHLAQLKMYAATFAGETGLTLDDLGFVTDNPSSAEAIKAAHETLRCEGRKAQRTFGSGFLNVGYLAACLRDEITYLRRQVYKTTPVWMPMFEADAAMLSSIGDGAIKLNQAVPGYIGKDNLRSLTGIKGSDLPAPAGASGNEA